MVPRENKNNAYAKFGGTNKEYYGISEVAYFINPLTPQTPQTRSQGLFDNGDAGNQDANTLGHPPR